MNKNGIKKKKQEKESTIYGNKSLCWKQCKSNNSNRSLPYSIKPWTYMETMGALNEEKRGN